MRGNQSYSRRIINIQTYIIFETCRDYGDATKRGIVDDTFARVDGNFVSLQHCYFTAKPQRIFR